jgi:hypothetical protein
MSLTDPPLTGVYAKVAGILGTAAAAVAPILPAMYQAPVAVLGCLACAFAGLVATPPAIAEGKPLVQGAALTATTTALTLLQQYGAAIPPGWPQSVAGAVAGLLAWATGHALPRLGSPAVTP